MNEYDQIAIAGYAIIFLGVPAAVVLGAIVCGACSFIDWITTPKWEG
jgi:carbonic anhydrase